MPALIIFGRRWQIGSDDLVLPSVIDLILRLVWLIILAVIVWRIEESSLSCGRARIFLIVFLGLLHVSIILDAALVQNSRKGSFMETEKRKYVNIFLYLRILVEVMLISANSTAAFWYWTGSFECNEITVLNGIIIFNWVLLAIQLLFVIYCYDPLGASHSLNLPYKENGDYFSKFGIDMPITKTKYSNRWENRCKFYCCSGLSCHGSKDEEVKDAFREVAKIFGSELGGEDLVPSDVVAGLILLAGQRKKQKSTRMIKEERTRELISRPSMDVILEEPNECKADGTNGDFENSVAWRSPKYLSHFVRFACAPFGWLLVALDRNNPVRRLCKHSSCCSCLPGRAQRQFSPSGDNCCGLNSAGLIDMLESVEVEDILHVSFKNKLFETPFYVAMDHETKAIVIGIRGTLSFNDVLLDFTGWPVHIPGFPATFKAHHGMLITSLKLKDKIEGLGILPKLLLRYPGYHLIITGHSLGSGCATILAMMLRDKYPTLKSYAYSPPGGLLSAEAAEYCNEFVTSIVYGDDMIARLGLFQFERLKVNLLAALRDSDTPKYQILLRGLLCSTRKEGKFKKCIKRTVSTESREQLSDNHSKIKQDTTIINISNYITKQIEAQSLPQKYNNQAVPDTLYPFVSGMYPPGKIAYITKSLKYKIMQTRRNPGPKYNWRWADRREFDDIIVSRRMLIDHVPVSMPHALHHIAKAASEMK